MIVIEGIEPGSLGATAGFEVGDRIKRVNGAAIRDLIDFQVHTAERELTFDVERDGELYEVELIRHEGALLGLEFGDLKLHRCNNRCVFCFIHQMPKGMRRSLYFEDDDYRLSFLHGSYVTLTNVNDADIDRIVDQGLSPLFVSVHATDPALRQRMLGRREPVADILARVRQLAENGVQMHCQVVLCPGLNDGNQLERTVNDLGSFYPAVRSVALVPVGLTRFREHLPKLAPVTPKHAAAYLEYAGKRGDAFAQRFGERFVYAADELFLIGGEPPPLAEYYDGFPQLENGIGMVRSFLDVWQSRRSELSGMDLAAGRVAIVSGELAACFLPQQLDDIRLLTGLEAELVVVKNEHFGNGITVSGLLTGGDISRALAGRDGLDIAFLPPNCINDEGVTLDDLTVADISHRTGIPVQVGAYDLARTLVSYLHGTEMETTRGRRPQDEPAYRAGRPV